MKKLKVMLLTLISVMAIVCCLAGCGSKAGTYKFYSITVLGTEYKAGEEVEIIPGVASSKITLSEDYITLTLNSDGTVKQTMSGKEASGTWKENADDSNKVDLTSAGVTTTVSCDGSTITIEVLGNPVVLKK